MILRTWLTGVLLLVSLRCDAASLGLHPSPPPLADPFAGLSAAERLQLIDVQERVLHADGQAPDAELYFRLGLLHLADESHESRNLALEALTQAGLLAPERLDIRLWQAEARARSRNVLGAIELLEGVADEYGHDPAWAYSWGYYNWLRGRHFLEMDNFRAARTGFLRAAKAQPEVVQYRLALAAAGLVLGDWETVQAATTTLHEGDRVFVPALLLRACGAQGAGNDQEAHELFQRALVSLPKEWSDAFLAAAQFLPRGIPDAPAARSAYWRAMDPHPAQRGNGRRMEFFRRVVEAELLFGSDETPGWTTQPGEAWVRWGRPSATVFQPAWIGEFQARSRPDPGKTVGAQQEGFSNAGPNARGTTISDIDPNMHRWYWSWSMGGDPIFLTFVNATFDYDWSLSSGGARAFREASVRLPLAFVEETVPPDIDVDLAVSGFLRGRESTALEAAVAVLPHDDFAGDAKGEDGSLARMDWALYDHRNLMIENGSVELDEGRWRSRLLKESGLELDAAEKNALIAQLGFRLAPGHYRLAVEAVREATGAQRNAVVEFELKTPPDDMLVLSDLELADSFEPYRNAMQVPREFVKHAFVIVPNAHRSYPVGSRRAYVYYEVDGLKAGPDGTTHFDVSYRVQSREPGARPTSSQFLSEETGTSEDQKVIKGTRIDLDGLGPGPYRLVVTVDDHVAGTSAERSVDFEIFGDTEALARE